MRPKLYPSQVCFVVDDVPSAAVDCAARFGWGPFMQFTAPVEDAEYRGWRGAKRTDVALGMAGPTQVELIHVHEGHDAVESYQAEYGVGFQHLGVGVRSRDEALAHLESLGAVLNEKLDPIGIRIAFVDLPTGPAMFELLEPTGEKAEGFDLEKAQKRPAHSPKATGPREPNALFKIDRATIVTRDMQADLAFFSNAFGWNDVSAQTQTLRHPGGESRIPRAIGRAGTLTLEFVAPSSEGDDPYADHLRRGAHGLAHAGGTRAASSNASGAAAYRWLETDEAFDLEDWAGGARSLQRILPA